MFELKNKTILILSPQSWGKMFISKHHYAVELARMGNTVFFLNPPDKSLSNRIVINQTEVNGLYIIDHRINFPYNIKFHAIRVFHFLMQGQIKRIIDRIEKRIDIVWSFDIGNLYPFSLFPKSTLNIYHPVDEPSSKFSMNAAKGADVILSVTSEILDKFRLYNIPCKFINHGVVEDFFYNDKVNRKTGQQLRVGYSGNLLRPDIDTETLICIFKEHAKIIFECWGCYQIMDANISGELNDKSKLFIETLKSLPNVMLHGAVSPNKLASAYQGMDAFLICYDIKLDQSKGTNYHKIMEYLASGKVIVSNNVSTYNTKPELIQMSAERDSNLSLPSLFNKVVENIELFNSERAMNIRIEYARNNLYIKQLQKIEKILQELKNNKK